MHGVRAWFARILDTAVDPGDDELTISRKRLLAGGGLTVPPALVGIGVVYAMFDEPRAGIAYMVYGLAALLQVCAFVWIHHRVALAFWPIAIAGPPSHLFVVLELGDLTHSGAIALWALAFPVATGMIFVTARSLAPFVAFYALNLAVTVFISPADRSAVPADVERWLLAANLFALSAFAVAVLYVFVAERDAAQQRARNLLLSILPEAIADELSQQVHVIAEQHDDVSVLFADVVGFTPMSAAMTPNELVALLDELFAAFDELVDASQLEKIKTVGDCYMVASGLPRARPDHAAAAVALGLAMQRVVATRSFSGRTLQLRVGVNSGSVVAGVIGRRKFSYDLWGDAVNTASRMESHGTVGGVQVTEATRALLGADFTCAPRGSIEVKGKGPLPVWTVSATVEP